MGFYARLSADMGGLTDQDAAKLAQDRLVEGFVTRGPISGFVMRNGRTTPFTLDTTDFTPEITRILPEQMVMAGLVLASFATAIWRLLG